MNWPGKQMFIIGTKQISRAGSIFLKDRAPSLLLIFSMLDLESDPVPVVPKVPRDGPETLDDSY